MSQATNSALNPLIPFNRISPDTAVRSVDDRILRAVQNLDAQLSTQQKAREQERKTYQQDVFTRSRELDALLASRSIT